VLDIRESWLVGWLVGWLVTASKSYSRDALDCETCGNVLHGVGHLEVEVIYIRLVIMEGH
jgi:hypothetical protein